MTKKILGRILWLGRGTATTMGVAVVLAVSTTALAAVPGDPFKLGKLNTIDRISQLIGSTNSAMLRIDNNSTGASATALDLQVEPGKSPMNVNSATKVTNLNADQLDGLDFTDFSAQELIDKRGPLSVEERTFNSEGGTLVISASGSGFRGTGSSQLHGRIGMDVFLDDRFVGTADVFTNERNSHKAFVDDFMVAESLVHGEHEIRLERSYDPSICNTPDETTLTYCTATDFNDRWVVTVTELPSS